MDFGSMIIVGAVVSLIVQVLKNSLQTSNGWTIVIVLAVSLSAGLFYVLFQNSVWWENFLKVLVAAGAVYTYIIRRFETPTP